MDAADEEATELVATPALPELERALLAATLLVAEPLNAEVDDVSEAVPEAEAEDEFASRPWQIILGIERVSDSMLVFGAH